MENRHDHIKLTASELSILFEASLNDTLGICTISYFLEHVEDSEIKSCLEYGLELSKLHIDLITNIFNEENIPIITEIGEYASDGVNIMISNGWLEKPPSVPDRKDLVRG